MIQNADVCFFPLTFCHIENCDLFYIWLLILILRKQVMRHVRGMSHQINDVIYKGQLGKIPTVLFHPAKTFDLFSEKKLIKSHLEL